MSLNYKSVITFPIWGSVEKTYQADRATVASVTRTPVTLESTYQAESPTVATKTFATSGFSKINIDIEYTMGAAESSNSIEILVEGSPDGIVFQRIPNDSTSGATSTLTAREFTFVGTNAGTAKISIGLDVFYAYMKFSAKETGVSANKGTIYGEATLLGL